jgi:ankyrin repeat protein
VNARIDDRRTPLHMASEAGCLEVTRLLLDRGARVNAWDRWGYTSTCRAWQRSHVKISLLLSDRGGVNI